MASYYTPDIKDEDLLVQLRTGSPLAFEGIYNRYWKNLLAIAYHHIADKAAAEEAVQDVFMSLWERRNALRINNLENYLATAVKFTIFRQLLKEKRRKLLLEQNYTGPTTQDPDTRFNDRQFEEFLQTEIDKLPEKCRLVFVYRRRDELSMAEIAGKMNISLKTAEAHLTKAVKRLHGSLKRLYFLFLAFTWGSDIFF